MKLLLLKIICISVPFFLWVSLLILVDPYNYFNLSHLVSNEVKINTSANINARLWKALEFKKNPSANILLGDSRTGQIDVISVNHRTGGNYFNFAHGGGSLPEIVSTFNYAKNITKLSNVYIGVNFNLYNEYNSANLFSGAELIANDYKYYLFNKSVAETLFLNLISLQKKQDLKIGIPPMDKEAFWQYSLNYSATYSYQRYKYPSTYYKQLKEIAAYCKLNNINLVFFVPPSHVDLQKKVADFGLVEAEVRFKKDLATLGTVYDFDYPNEWTKKRENFNDPFHFTKVIMEKFVDEIWGNSHKIARISNLPSYN